MRLCDMYVCCEGGVDLCINVSGIDEVFIQAPFHISFFSSTDIMSS